MKKKLAAVFSVVLILGLAVLGILAYLTDTDNDVNVMTLGNVDIEQIEKERVEQTNSGDDALQNFTGAYPDKNHKPLYPAVYDEIDWARNADGTQVYQKWPTGGASAMFDASMKNVQDKIVFVENTGKSDTYVRTWFAFEAGDLTVDEINNGLIHWNRNDANPGPGHWKWTAFSEDMTTTIDGTKYYLRVATYVGSEDVHKGGILPAGETTRPSLLQVFLDSKATNDDIVAFGDEYQILVFSEAGQIEGFEDPTTALNEMFGPITANNHPWDNGIYPKGTFKVGDKPFKTFDEAITEAITSGNEIVVSGAIELEGTVNIPGSVTITGENAVITRADGFTGTMIQLGEGATLTLKDVVLDGAGATATGNLIAAGNNSKIILETGSVLQNNVGAHAINLGTRIGATLTINGGEIINNSSDSGAIWGGGNITMNSGKISNNTSTGIGGAIRMVSNCNFTMNGGEMNNNKAAGDGGAIWGYGSSTYNFNGGEIANNESAGTGGFMYTGTYSVINISGDFELHDNKAANSGAIRLTDHTSMNMTGGKIYGNTQNGESNAFNTWNNSISITGGEVSDDFSFVGGLGLTIGKADIDGVISYDLSTNHNTAYLAADFNAFKFKVDASNSNFANFNFKPAAGYTYTAGDESKLICMNEGYETYWDAATGTFRLKAK